MSEPEIGVEAVELYLPPARRPLADVLAREAESPADVALLESLGIDEVPDATGTGAADLAISAGRLLCERRGLAPTALDVLVYIPGRVPDKLMASEVTRVQHGLGAADATCVSTGDLGCTSSSSALLVARSLLVANPTWSTALVLHGCRAPVSRRYRRPVTVGGDCGVAALLSRSPRFVLHRVALRSDGRFWDLFSVDYHGRAVDEWREECTDHRAYSFTLAVESRRVLAALADEVLTGLGWQPADVTHLLMQNISVGGYRFYEQVFGRPVAPVCAANLRRYGHLGAADVLVNLRSLAGHAVAGDRVLMLNNSPSAAWSVTALTVRET